MPDWLVDLWRSEHTWPLQLVASVALVLLGVVVHWALRRVILRADVKSADLRRRWIVGVRNLIALAVLFALVIVWAQQLRTLAVSLVAFVAVIVISLKELILCFTGSALKLGSRSFSLGDRVAIGAFRGDVIDQTLLTTTLLEVGPGENVHHHSGRKVTIPNAMFLNTPVINESIAGDYTVHSFVVPVKRADRPDEAEQQLLTAAAEAIEPYRHRAASALAALKHQQGFEGPSAEPRVTFLFPDADRVDLLVRIPAPVDGKRGVQQQIVRRFLELRYGEPKPVESESTQAEGDTATPI